MLSFDEALRTVVEATDPVAAERVSVFEAAGRILREDIHAPAPLPGFDYSAMDGYAFRHADLGPAPHQLSLVGTSSAGEPLDALAPNSACRIYTGAIVPAGADTVIMQEEVRAEPNRIEFGVAPTLGANIRKTGEDMAAGALALRAGEELHPGRVALAACLDRATLVVSRRPLVSVLGTGDELRSPGELGEVGSVVESNGFFVKAAAERAGASARLQRFARDSEGALDEAIASALEGGGDPSALLADKRFRGALVTAIENLPEREKQLMGMYYEQDMNLREIGAVMGVTESRVCQLHSQAVARLRAKLKSW